MINAHNSKLNDVMYMHKGVLNNFNRLLIFSLTMAGLLMDGYQAADLLCACSLVIWLWLPVCIQIELNTLKRFQRYSIFHFFRLKSKI